MRLAKIVHTFVSTILNLVIGTEKFYMGIVSIQN